MRQCKHQAGKLDGILHSFKVKSLSLGGGNFANKWENYNVWFFWTSTFKESPNKAIDTNVSFTAVNQENALMVNFLLEIINASCCLQVKSNILTITNTILVKISDWQGAFFGQIASTAFTGWIVFSGYLHAKYHSGNDELPTSIDGCLSTTI